MQALQRCAGEFELTGRLQRDRFVAALETDWVAVILDPIPAVIADTFEHRANAVGFIGGRAKVAQPKAEFLVLGANAECGGRLAAFSQILGHLLHRGDRCEVGFPGV